MPHAHTLCQEAAEHIQLIRAGDGDEELRGLHARLGEDLGVHAVAADAHDVITVDDFVDHGIAVVHRHQIVALMGEGAENGFADFPAADDDNFHRTNTSMIDNSSGLRPGQSRDPLLAGFKAVDPVGFQVVDQIDQ